MPICEAARRAGLAAGLMLAAACAPVATPVEAPSRPGALIARDASALRSARVSLPTGDVRVAVPRGACIVPSSVRVNAVSGTVMAGDCRAITSRPGRDRPMEALLTASVSAEPLPGEGSPAARIAAIEALLHGGLAETLLTDGSERARLVETRLAGDTVYALVAESADEDGPAPLYWRAISQERGHMIVLSARTWRAGPLGTQDLLDRMRAFREATRAANRRG